MTQLIPRRNDPVSGFTLIEMLIAASIFSFGVLGFFNSFNFIARAIQANRGQTLATNLAQERIESLKNSSYYALVVTTVTTANTNFSPNVVYSNGAYGPESRTVGGITFTVSTKVDFIRITSTGTIATIPYTDPDPGMKQITVWAIWKDGRTWKKYMLTNLLENPEVAPQNASITGTVTISGGGNLDGAQVKALENPSLQAYTNASGAYTFSVNAGTYTLYCSSSGYFAAASNSLVVNSGASATQNFTLTKMSTGSIKGEVWVSTNHLLVSQIVTSTFTMIPELGYEADVEYVELFNPTTYPINVLYPYLYYYATPSWQFNYTAYYYAIQNSTYIKPGGYYLIANTTHTFAISGSSITPDMGYQTTSLGGTVDFPNLFPAGTTESTDAGNFRLWTYTGAPLYTFIWQDVGWEYNNDNPDAYYEGKEIETKFGIRQGEQIVRFSSLTTTSDTYGRAYHWGNNRRDYEANMNVAVELMTRRPYNVASGTKPVISGTPLRGAVVSVNDDFSVSTVTIERYITGPGGYDYYYADYTLSGVSTGTWTVAFTSNTLYTEISSVTISSMGAVRIVPSSTTFPSPGSYSASPILAAAATGHTILASTGAYSYISGFVRDASNKALSGILVSAGGVPRTTNAQGFYFAAVSSGANSVIFNQGNANPSYTSEVQTVNNTLGVVTASDQILSRGGTLKGYVTSGSSPLPNMTAVALRNGNQMGTGASDTSGNFYISNLATGTYTVEMAIDPAASPSPVDYTSTVVASTTVFVGTFTVTGAFGTLTGTVKKSTGNITTGALIIASTSTIASTPPTLTGVGAPAGQMMYAATSASDGTYELQVRGATHYTYNLRAWYTTFSGTTPTSATVSYSGQTVSASGTTTLNITFP